MEWTILIIILLVILFGLLFSGQWIAFAMGTASTIGLFIVGQQGYLSSYGSIVWNNMSSQSLIAIPLFVLMGELVLTSGISARFYRGITPWISWIPGGLLHSNSIACAFFAAISGSSVATCAAVGSVAVPELSERGYDRKLTFGTLGAGGTLGMLIPPSVTMIVYGVLTQQSVAKLFMAGVFPGLLLLVLFMIYTATRCIINPTLVGEEDRHKKYSGKDRISSFKDIIPLFLIIALIMASIYTGFATPSEAAALADVFAVVIVICYRAFNWKMFKKCMMNTVKTSCMVLFIVVGAQMLSFFMVKSGISRSLTEWVVSLNMSHVGFLVLMVLIYFVLGCIMEAISMIYLTIPILFPIIDAMDFNLIWFGVFLTMLIEVGQITPPVGMNLFVLQGISGGRPIGEVVRGCIPFFLIIIGSLAIIYLLPALCTWLPATM